ncbi:hypothetical protein OROMI_030421 [Orobanche minor]
MDVVCMNPDQVGWESWLFEMKKVFEAVSYSETRRVPLAQYFLVKEAATWWQAVKPQGHVAYGNEFKNLIETEFCPWPVLIEEGL